MAVEASFPQFLGADAMTDLKDATHLHGPVYYQRFDSQKIRKVVDIPLTGKAVTIIR